MSDTYSTPLHMVEWDNRESVMSFVDACVKLREDENVEVERQAEMNTAWYRGHQLVFWHRDQKRLVAQDNPNGRVRLTFNLMRPMIDGWVSKLNLSTIRLTCEPASDDLVDFEEARIRGQILEYYNRELNLRRMTARSDLAACLHGETFIKCVWDAQRGDLLAPIEGESFELTKEEKQRSAGLKTGDLALTALTLFQVFWGPAGVAFEDAEWVLELHERSAAHVAQRYGLKPKELDTRADIDVKIIRPGESSVFGQTTTDRPPGVVLVKELWVRANAAIEGLEKGRHIVAVSNKVVINGKNPYKHERIPIVRYPLLPVEGSARADTFVSDLIPVQADLNRSVSQFCENREYMANPVWLVPEFGAADEKEWTNKPGGIRRYRGPIKPNLEPGQIMPAIVFQMMMFARQTMQEIIGLRDASQGKNPVGGRSARLAAILKEADDERMGIIAEQRTDVWRTVGWLMLQTLGQYATEERVVRILGEDRRSHTVTFSAKNLKNVSPYDIFVETNGRPRSRSARLEDADRAMERGFLRPDDPKDKQYVLDLLELGGARRRIDPKAAARDMQHNRNQMMSEGKYEGPAYYEDIDTMKEVLDEYRGRDFFRGFERDKQALFMRYDAELIKAAAVKALLLKLLTRQALQELGVLQPGSATVPGPPAPPPMDQGMPQGPPGMTGPPAAGVPPQAPPPIPVATGAMNV